MLPDTAATNGSESVDFADSVSLESRASIGGGADGSLADKCTNGTEIVDGNRGKFSSQEQINRVGRILRFEQSSATVQQRAGSFIPGFEIICILRDFWRI